MAAAAAAPEWPDGYHAASSVRLESAERLAWAHGGALQLSAQLHAAAPQFSADGGAALWEAVVGALLPPPPPLPPPWAPHAAPCALRTLLRRLDPPPPVATRVLHRTLSLLCFGLAADGSAPPPPPSAPPLPSFRTPALDEVLGECVERLALAKLPPLPSLAARARRPSQPRRP